MASVAFDSDVSGDGTASWASAGVLFVSCDLLTVGVVTHPLDQADRYLRAGWFSLGDEFDIGLGTFEYWRPPIFTEWTHLLWTPPVTGDGGGSQFIVTATRIRWHFAVDVTAHLHVLIF